MALTAPVRADSRSGVGNRKAAQKVEDRSRPPWLSWRTRSLCGRAIRFIEIYCVAAKGMHAGQPLVLARWQRNWLEASLAGDVDASALTLPRGNGKSTFTGAVATWAAFDPKVADRYGGQPDIPVIAPTLRQARKGCYGAAVTFRRKHPDLAARSLRYTASGEERIVVPFNEAGELYPVAADPATLQGLDPLMALVDEIGFISVEAWDAVLLAAGKRPRNLILALGTRNPSDDPNALDHLLAQIAGHGTIDRFRLVDYSADAHALTGDRLQWRKANPALDAGYLRESALESALELSPDAAFRCFRLNLKSGSHDGWLGVDGPTIWTDTERAEVIFDPDAPVHIGVDKSAYSDSSAVVAIQHQAGDRWLIKARVFLPAPTIDHAAVRDHLRDLDATLNVAAIGFDPRYFVEGAQELADEGLPMIEVAQTPQRLVGPYSLLYRDFVDRRIVHEPDTVFRRHVLGAVPKLDSSGGFTLAKGRSKVHIDAAVALGIARSVSDVELAGDPDPSTLRIHL